MHILTNRFPQTLTQSLVAKIKIEHRFSGESIDDLDLDLDLQSEQTEILSTFFVVVIGLKSGRDSFDLTNYIKGIFLKMDPQAGSEVFIYIYIYIYIYRERESKGLCFWRLGFLTFFSCDWVS